MTGRQFDRRKFLKGAAAGAALAGAGIGVPQGAFAQGAKIKVGLMVVGFSGEDERVLSAGLAIEAALAYQGPVLVE